MMRRIIRPGDTVIDVGANVGYLAAVAAALVGPDGSVHAFEPEPRLHAELADLARRNPRYGIVANACALGAEHGEATLAVSGDNIGWNTLVPEFMAAPRETHRVEVIPFDEYADRHGLARVSFVKIDTEGFEYQVLSGMRRFLARERPVIHCEIAPTAFPRLGIDSTGFAALLDELGYDVTDRRRPVAIAGLTRTSDAVLLPRRGAR
jgi:FkbM family methyltransferase